jgi:hypothetical protein
LAGSLPRYSSIGHALPETAHDAGDLVPGVPPSTAPFPVFLYISLASPTFTTSLHDTLFSARKLTNDLLLCLKSLLTYYPSPLSQISTTYPPSSSQFSLRPGSCTSLPNDTPSACTPSIYVTVAVCLFLFGDRALAQVSIGKASVLKSGEPYLQDLRRCTRKISSNIMFLTTNASPETHRLRDVIIVLCISRIGQRLCPAPLVVHPKSPDDVPTPPHCSYSILFLPSSSPSSRASLFPRSCFVPTRPPTTGLCDTRESVSCMDSMAWGSLLSFGQLTCPCISIAVN